MPPCDWYVLGFSWGNFPIACISCCICLFSVGIATDIRVCSYRTCVWNCNHCIVTFSGTCSHWIWFNFIDTQWWVCNVDKSNWGFWCWCIGHKVAPVGFNCNLDRACFLIVFTWTINPFNDSLAFACSEVNKPCALICFTVDDCIDCVAIVTNSCCYYCCYLCVDVNLSLGKKSNPCVSITSSSSCSLIVNCGLIVYNDVFVCSGAQNHWIIDLDMGLISNIDWATSNERWIIKLTNMFTTNVCTH